MKVIRWRKLVMRKKRKNKEVRKKQGSQVMMYKHWLYEHLAARFTAEGAWHWLYNVRTSESQTTCIAILHSICLTTDQDGIQMAQFYIISEKFTEKRQINSPHKLLQFRCLERVVGEGAHPELGEERVAQTHLCTPPFYFLQCTKSLSCSATSGSWTLLEQWACPSC